MKADQLEFPLVKSCVQSGGGRTFKSAAFESFKPAVQSLFLSSPSACLGERVEILVTSVGCLSVLPPCACHAAVTIAEGSQTSLEVTVREQMSDHQ